MEGPPPCGPSLMEKPGNTAVAPPGIRINPSKGLGHIVGIQADLTLIRNEPGTGFSETTVR